jgi:serine/threonine protein kinase
MPDAVRCPQCDALIPPDAVAGLCPQCLLRLAVAIEPDAGETLPIAGEPEESAEHQFGPYRVVRQLGEGGMGTVYLAEQQEPIRRLVALKVIKLGMGTREVIARFDSERQALALMDHPHIARVFDAGASDMGRPYFVMEYVDGIPIT